VRVDVAPAAPDERPVLARLLQLYQYDFSEIDGGDLDPSGLYSYVEPDPWFSRPDHRPFLIRVEGHLAGFALVRQHAPDDFEIEEFFVVRKYRRRHVGEQAARQLFDRFPGRWCASQTRDNHAARFFWRGVIDRYTEGRFRETLQPALRYPASTQAFDSRLAR
jgi:predicted acetyltransferase